MSNTELTGRQVQLGEHEVVVVTRWPALSEGVSMLEVDGEVHVVETHEIYGTSGCCNGSYAWSHAHLVQYHGIDPEEIERDLASGNPDDGVLGRHYKDHEREHRASLPVAHVHVGGQDFHALTRMTEALRLIEVDVYTDGSTAQTESTVQKAADMLAELLEIAFPDA